MQRFTSCLLQLGLYNASFVRTALHRRSEVSFRVIASSTLRKSRHSFVTPAMTANSVDNSFWTGACQPEKVSIVIILNYTLPDQVEKLLSKGIGHP